MINLPKFKIGNSGKILEINIIQGGMGVGVSRSRLPSAVANCGGAGIIASVGLGLLKGYLEKHNGNYAKANQEGLREEIREARKKSNGVIGVNIMHALSDYVSLVETAVEENIDLIISGAGVPRDLPKYLNGKDIKLIPIVSSARYSNLICKAWSKIERPHPPDAIIVEGPKAGGHLGFKREQLDNPEYVKNALETIVKEVVKESKQFGQIPVIAAGGIYNGQDIKKALGWEVAGVRVAGVQMATRFVPTFECDADDKFKQTYLNATKEDTIIIDSPVGMPGRAINNSFLKKIQLGEKNKFKCGFKCLKTCNPKESPYCIANALVEAQQGDFTRGYAFAGANAYKCTPETCLDENREFISVRTLMERLSNEYNSAF